MAGPSAVSDTERQPRYDIVLSDGTNSVGLVLVNGNGQPAPQLGRIGMPNDALLASQGQSEYSNYDQGYLRVEQSDWTGGRGLDDLDKDKTRYYDGIGINPTSQAVLCGPCLQYSDGFITENKYMPDDVTIAGKRLTLGAPYAGSRYLANKFTAPSGGYTMSYIEIHLRKVGTPTAALTVAIYSNSSGNPGTLLASATVAVADITDTTWKQHRISLSYTLSSSTDYWVVLYGGSSDDMSNHWETWCWLDMSNSGRVSGNGTSWTALFGGPLYRIYPSYTTGAMHFFNYKGAEYGVTQPDTGNSFLWMNGDRGAADSNSGALGTLVDATKSWTTNEWAGCVAMIIAGPGSEEKQPWRTISSNTATTLTLSSSWIVTHTTSTEYVILKSNKWSVVAQDFGSGSADGDLRALVTDVADAGNWVYFARGDTGSSNIIRYQEYNNGGTWTRRYDTENVIARNICAIRHPEDLSYTLYGSQHTGSGGHWFTRVFSGKIPRYWGDLYQEIGTLANTNTPWDAVPVANVTQSVYSGFTKIAIAAGATTGVVAADDLATAVDITQGEYLAVLASSSITTIDTDFDFSYSSSAALGDTEIDCNFPALTAGQWAWALIPISPLWSSTTGSNAKAVLSVGLKMVTDVGAVEIALAEDIKVIRSDLSYTYLPPGTRITKIIPYGGSATEPRKNPWIITEDAVYEIQTQNDNSVVPLPLEEIATLSDPANGNASGVNDVYLYFNLGRKLERYYQRNLDDVGMDLDAGLPADRIGDLFGFVSYPGRLFTIVDGGSSNYSSIMELRGSAWHTTYRSPSTGRRIRGMGIQTIPGSSIQRLWFKLEDTICWLPISLNPLTDGEYTFTYEGVLESPWLYCGTKGIKKVFKSITIFADEVDSSNSIAVDYKVDDDTDSWTYIGSLFYTGPFTELDFATTPPTGYRLKYRLRLLQDDLSNVSGYVDAIKLRAVVINGFGIAPIKHGWDVMCMVGEEEYGTVNLQMERDAKALAYSARVETTLALLDTWAGALTPLTMTSRISPVHNRKVLIKDPRILLWKIDSNNQVEQHLLQLTVHDY